MRNFALVVASTFIASQAASQEMRPLGKLLQNAATLYPPTRCAGLYQAVMEWTGFERMGEDTWNQTDSHRENFIWVAVRTSQSLSGGTLEQQAEIVVRDVRNIADIYLERFERNYAAQGQAFGEDALILSDIDLCGTLVGALQ
jgi:hypothetical protein